MSREARGPACRPPACGVGSLTAPCTGLLGADWPGAGGRDREMPAPPGRIPEGQGPQTRAEGQRVLHAWGERGRRRRRTPALHFEMVMMTMTTMCVCVYLCDALCVRVCVGVSVWVCTCVYVCVCMCVHVWVRANAHVINMQDANLEGG